MLNHKWCSFLTTSNRFSLKLWTLVEFELFEVFLHFLGVKIGAWECQPNIQPLSDRVWSPDTWENFLVVPPTTYAEEWHMMKGQRGSTVMPLFRIVVEKTWMPASLSFSATALNSFSPGTSSTTWILRYILVCCTDLLLSLCMLSRSARYCWTDSSLSTVDMNATMLKNKMCVKEYQQYHMEEWAIECILKEAT